MFNKIEISLWRAFFWPVANLIYWGLIFLAWWDTRFKVFLGFSYLRKFGELRNYSAVLQQAAELENQANISVAQSGIMPNEFIMIPLVMSVVLFLVPFVVRRDHKAPVSGAVILPAMTILCYIFASFLNIIVVAALSAGIHYMLFKVPGPDMFMFMVHPLYLIYPLFHNIPGFASQCLYFVYVASVLSTDTHYEEESDYEDQANYTDAKAEDDWDHSACVMEMDRLTRILNTKFETPSFLDRIRTDIAEYISKPGLVKNEVRAGNTHYKIVLTETKNSILRIIEETPVTPKAREALTFIIDEMARMQFIMSEDAQRIKNTTFGTSSAESPQSKVSSIIPAAGNTPPETAIEPEKAPENIPVNAPEDAVNPQKEENLTEND